MRKYCFIFVLLLICFVPVPRIASQSVSNSLYRDSPEGLKTQLQELLNAESARDEKKLSNQISFLTIPSHKDWFHDAFGSKEGPNLEARYVELQDKPAIWLKGRLEACTKQNKKDLDVKVIQSPDDTLMPLLKIAAASIVRPTAIYNVNCRSNPDDKSQFFLGEFVYVDGAFRYLDHQVLQALSNAPPMRITIGGNVQASKLVNKVQPNYPVEARDNHIQGTVVLHVIIAKDGSVTQIQVVSGDPSLVSSALDAVRQWRYQPTLLDGQPVEVDTRVNVTFQLSP